MSGKDLILAIDNGTQSVRALVFDLHGNLLARSQVILEPYFSQQPGWAVSVRTDISHSTRGVPNTIPPPD